MKFRMVHENYNVADLAASMAFYEKALGLKEVRRKTAPDGAHIIVYLSNEESDFELELTWLRDHPQKYDIGEEEFHLAFKTDDFEAAHKLCAVGSLFVVRPVESLVMVRYDISILIDYEPVALAVYIR